MKKLLIEFLKMNEVEYKENVLIKNVSPIKIGGIASIIIFPSTINKLISAVNFLQDNEINYIVVGKMSNILFKDCKVDAVIIKTDKMKGFEVSDVGVKVLSGDSISKLAINLADVGYGGLSELCGIPGSIGGLIYNNAGAFGKSIGDVVKSVKLYDPSAKNIVVLKKDELSFGYRTSVLKKQKYVVLEASLDVVKDKSENIINEINKFKCLRSKTQPIGFPSLGSVFKRPKNGFASKLIDDAGLKGYAIGGAQVSSKHAGFIINTGRATGEEYIVLMEYIKRVVFEKFGTMLEEEIEII